MKTCPPPLCAEYELRVIDRATGYTVESYGVGDPWLARYTKRENQYGNIAVDLTQPADCCPPALQPWCYDLELWRECGCRIGCWRYTGSQTTDTDGDRTTRLSGVTPMWLALQRQWVQSYSTTRPTTAIFELALENADCYDPLGIARQPVPIDVDVTIEVDQGEFLLPTWQQLQTGTLEWTEYHNGTYCSTVRYGEIAYDAQYTLTADDWDGDPPPLTTDGTLAASTVQVISDVPAADTTEGDDAVVEDEELVTASWPPADPETGKPARGSQKVWLPVTIVVPGLVDETEATQVAKRAWEKRQTVTTIETPTNGLSKSSGLCVCDLYPGGVYGSAIESACETITGDMRMSEVFGVVRDGVESLVSPSWVGGQA